MHSYVTVESDGIRWTVGADHVELFESGPFSRLDETLASARLEKQLTVKRTHRVEIGERVFFVKRYRSPGVWARLKRWLLGPRARAELERCLAVMRRGVPTVPLTAAGERGEESFVVVEKLDGWSILEDVMRGGGLEGGDPRELMFQYGEWARQVLDAGVRQDDFNPSNVLVKPWGDAVEFKLIDFERLKVVRRIGERDRLWLVAKMRRLPRVPRAWWDAFLEGYLHKYPEEQRRQREIEAQLERLQRELVARDSAHLSRTCTEETRNFGRFELDGWTGWRRKPQAVRDVEGIEEAELASVAEGRAAGYERAESRRVEEEWRRANAAALSGGRVPLAAFMRRGGSDGFVVYRAGGAPASE